MDDLSFVSKIQKIIKMRHDDVVAAMVSGAVDNMEKYQYMLGQVRTYQYLNQEISSLLNKKEQKEKTKGGLLLADETVERSQVASTCGLVLRMGPHCYDKERYPEGPWCKKGDWIIFARYAGSRIKIDGGEIRLLNDDEVLATVENPEDIFHEF